MMKKKGLDCKSGHPKRPSPERSDGKSKGEESPSIQDGQLGTLIGQGPINIMEESLAFLRKVKAYFKDVDLSKYHAFVNLLVAQKHRGVGNPCVISQVKEIFQGHTEVLKLFNEILKPGFKILFEEDVPETQDLANLYMAKVKTRSSPSEYTTFLHILYLYQERALTSDKVDQEVEALFANACDLLEEFDCFRPDRAAPVVQSPLHPRHSALEVSELEREQQRERLQRTCEDVAKRKRKEKGKGVVSERKQQQRPPPERVSARLANAAIALGNRRSLRSSVEVHPRRPTRSAIGSAPPATETQGQSRKQDVQDVENSINPSYLMLKPPKNGNNSGNGDGEGKDKGKGKRECEVSVHRSELAKSVLNEEFTLVKETEFRSRTLNPHEKVMHKCEEDQYECDMIIKRLEAAAKSFKTYLLKLQEPNVAELPPMEELLLPMHKRCIQQLYEDDAKTFMASLEANPAGALPILLNRLTLKLEELKSKKAIMTQTWIRLNKNNFRLSYTTPTIY